VKGRVLIIGAQFSGTFCVRELKSRFDVTIVDAKEYFEYTPGVLRAYVKPAHFDALTFTLQRVLRRKMGVTFIWGEVEQLDGPRKVAAVRPMFADATETIAFDYCIICAGCNFGPFKPMGESLWFPTVHARARDVSEWGHIDERFIEGRRRHILEEYHKIADLNRASAAVLVVGAGFIGVEWVTELRYFFADLKLTVIDFLPRCLGPLPDSAAHYCSNYMHDVSISEVYNTKYEPRSSEFWSKIDLPNGAAETYVCIGVKASNYFMPPEVLSDTGPGGGGWIHFNMKLQVVYKPTAEQGKRGKPWGDGSVFAVGDCNLGCIGNPPNFELPPIPKISYPGEEQAFHACKSVQALSKAKKAKKTAYLDDTWWPWGAGMFATSLGPHDACFVLGANEKKGSGSMVNCWYAAALQKELIESTKIDECKDRPIGKMIWHFVHHTPMHLWGRGPCCG